MRNILSAFFFLTEVLVGNYQNQVLARTTAKQKADKSDTRAIDMEKKVSMWHIVFLCFLASTVLLTCVLTSLTTKKSGQGKL